MSTPKRVTYSRIAADEQPPVEGPKVDGVISVSSTTMQVTPNQTITIDDNNAHLWAPVTSIPTDTSAPSGKDSPAAARYVTRSTLAFRLRASGMSYEDIAATFHADPTIAPGLPGGYGPSDVNDDVRLHLHHLREEVADSLQDVLTLEIQRFDMMLNALWPAITAGDTTAITTALKVSERRSRMLGLDKPIEVSWQVEIADLLSSNAITVEEAKAQLGEEMFGQFVQYLEERNETLLDGEAPGTRRLYEDSNPGGRFLESKEA